MKKLWFKEKEYGWGWSPSSWQGWVIMIIYLLLVCGATMQIAPSATFSNSIAFVAELIFLTMFLVFICIQTGEAPRWRWGKQG